MHWHGKSIIHQLTVTSELQLYPRSCPAFFHTQPHLSSTAMPLRLPHPASPITHLSSLHHSSPIKFPTRPLLLLSPRPPTFVNQYNYNTHHLHQKPATMSTKPTPVEQVQQASQHSKPCCTIPPIVSEKEYKPQGAYQTIDGVETCSSIPLPSSHPPPKSPN